MKSFPSLPDGYRKIYSVNLQNDKKIALLVNVLALIIAAILVVPMVFLVPITYLFNFKDDPTGLFVRMGALLVLTVAYMVLHELVHGVAMKLCGTKKVKYGFTGMYAFAGSNDYYNKSAYIFIALAPVVLWGIALAIITPLVPIEWFWVVYFIQITNLSGAAGDLFVTLKFSRMPNDILVKDTGVGMTVFSRK